MPHLGILRSWIYLRHLATLWLRWPQYDWIIRLLTRAIGSILGLQYHTWITWSIHIISNWWLGHILNLHQLHPLWLLLMLMRKMYQALGTADDIGCKWYTKCTHFTWVLTRHTHIPGSPFMAISRWPHKHRLFSADLQYIRKALSKNNESNTGDVPPNFHQQTSRSHCLSPSFLLFFPSLRASCFAAPLALSPGQLCHELFASSRQFQRICQWLFWHFGIWAPCRVHKFEFGWSFVCLILQTIWFGSNMS